MESNFKLPHLQTDDELLKNLNEAPLTIHPKDRFDDPVTLFVATYNIEPGPNRVTQKTLFKLFRYFADTSISVLLFGNKMRMLLSNSFEQTKGNNCIYKINLNGAQMSQLLFKATQKHQIRRIAAKSTNEQFKQFLYDNNIIKGDYYVPIFILYYLYDEWKFKKGIKKGISEKVFPEFCRINLESKRLSRDKLNWYGINKEELTPKLTDEKVQQIEEWYDKKKNKKKSRKVSSPQSSLKS